MAALPCPLLSGGFGSACSPLRCLPHFAFFLAHCSCVQGTEAVSAKVTYKVDDENKLAVSCTGISSWMLLLLP